MKRKVAQVFLTVFTLTGVGAAISACNIAGAGQDISATGHAITNEANEHK